MQEPRDGKIQIAAACATATPRSFTNLTASSLNSRLNFLFAFPLSSSVNHLISVSTKPPAAGQTADLRKTAAARERPKRGRKAAVKCIDYEYPVWADSGRTCRPTVVFGHALCHRIIPR